MWSYISLKNHVCLLTKLTYNVETANLAQIKMVLKDTTYCMYIHINIPLNIFVVPGYNILVCTALTLVYTMLLNVKHLRPIVLMTGGCYWLWRLRNDLSTNWSNDNAVFLIVFWLWSSSDEFWPPFPYSVYHTRTCFPGSSFLIATCSSACTNSKRSVDTGKTVKAYYALINDIGWIVRFTLKWSCKWVN